MSYRRKGLTAPQLCHDLGVWLGNNFSSSLGLSFPRNTMGRTLHYSSRMCYASERRTLPRVELCSAPRPHPVRADCEPLPAGWSRGEAV